MRQEDIREYFRSQGPSETQKDRILAGVLEQYEQETQGEFHMCTKTKRSVSKIAVIAAVMVLTTVSAFAAVPEFRDWIGGQFGLTAEQEADLAASGTLQNIQASASNGNLTMTVHQALVDEQGMYIIYDVDSDDGSAVDVSLDDLQFQASESAGVFLYSIEQKVLETREDGVTCMALLTGLEDLSGQEVSLSSCGLTCRWTVGETAEIQKIEADLTGKDLWTGRPYHVTGCGLSPICVKLDLDGAERLQDSGFPDQVAVEVANTDGSVKTIQSVGSCGKETEDYRYQMFLFDEIIDVDRVQAVYVDGVKLN